MTDNKNKSYISFVLLLAVEHITPVVIYSCCLMTYKVRRFSIGEASLGGPIKGLPF